MLMHPGRTASRRWNTNNQNNLQKRPRMMKGKLRDNMVSIRGSSQPMRAYNRLPEIN